VVEFKDELGGTRADLAERILDELDDGPMKTAELRDALWSEFTQHYKNEGTFHRTLSYIGDYLEENGDIRREVDPDSPGSRMAKRWIKTGDSGE